MVATAYTGIPLPSEGMSTGIHKQEAKRLPAEPAELLARNLKSAFKARGYSARSVAEAIGISNKTVSNMLNGVGSSQLDNLVAVAKHIRVPLWQLLAPTGELSQSQSNAMVEMFEALANLSELGRAAVRRTLKAEAALARSGQDSDET